MPTASVGMAPDNQPSPLSQRTSPCPKTRTTGFQARRTGFPARPGLTLLLLGWLLVGLLAGPVYGVIIFTKNSPQPIAAYLVAEAPDKITIRQPLPGGKFRERVLLRSQIEDLIVTVSPKRLGELRPDVPKGYRDYAEELAEKRRDPDARRAAMRLYLIAAHLAPGQLGRSSLMGMADLAETPDDEKKFRAMAYLLDPGHDRQLLKQPDRTVKLPAAAAPQSQQAVMAALRLLRQGHYDRALQQGFLVKDAFEGFGQHVTYGEFAEVCRRRPPSGIPEDLLRRILELELGVADAANVLGAADPAQKASPKSWSRILTLGGDRPVPSLSLETITEFDPRKCLFRNGRWVEPHQKGPAAPG